MATAKRKQEERADEMDETSEGDDDDENLRDFGSIDSCNNNKATTAQNYGLDVLSSHVTQ